MRNAGFTYLGVLILLAIISLTATASIQVGSIAQRRGAEEELLEIGREFRSALAGYAAASLPGQKRSPSKLEELLRDPRYPDTRRHLRKLYTDPITGKDRWGLIMAADGSGIVGVHSLSEENPIKIANFEPPFEKFAYKPSYRHWVFQP